MAYSAYYFEHISILCYYSILISWNHLEQRAIVHQPVLLVHSPPLGFKRHNLFLEFANIL